MSLDLSLFLLVFDHLHHHVDDGDQTKYKWGAKAPSLTADTSTIDLLDCSGFSRYAVARASNQAIIMPDGSEMQRDWCTAQGLTRVPYVQKTFQDNYEGLCIAFIERGATRHVWFVHEGETYECSPSVGGVGSRIWSSGVLRRNVTDCFVFPAS